MKTEQEFESYVKELGKQGIRKRQQRIKVISSVSGAVALGLVAVFIVWRAGLIRPITNSSDNAMPNYNHGSDSLVEEMHSEVTDLDVPGASEGIVTPADKVDSDENHYELGAYQLQYFHDGLEETIPLSPEQVESLTNWYDSLEFDTMKSERVPEEGLSNVVFMNFKGINEVRLSGKWMIVKDAWYVLNDADRQAVETLLSAWGLYDY